MTAEGWEHFQHQADIGVRGFGLTKEAAFAQANTWVFIFIVCLTDCWKLTSIESLFAPAAKSLPPFRL